MTVSTNDSVTTGFMLVCHRCRKRYPMEDGLSLRKAVCCEKPDIHIHDPHRPCEYCDDGSHTIVRLIGRLRKKNPRGLGEACGNVEPTESEKYLKREWRAALARTEQAKKFTDAARGVAFERQEMIEGVTLELQAAQDTVRERGVLLKRVQAAVRASGDYRDAVDAVEALAAWVWPSREAAGESGAVTDARADALGATREANLARGALLNRVRMAMGAVCWEAGVGRVEAMAKEVRTVRDGVKARAAGPADQERALALEEIASIRKSLSSVDYLRASWPRTMTVEEAVAVKGWGATITVLLAETERLYTQVDGLHADLQIRHGAHIQEGAETKRLLELYQTAEKTVWVPLTEKLSKILISPDTEGLDDAAKRVMGERNSAQRAHGKTLEALSVIEHIDACACLDGDCEHDLSNECLERVSADLRTVGGLVREILVACGES